MFALYRFFLVLMVLFVALAASASARGVGNSTATTSLSWNISNRNLPLLSLPDVLRGDLNALLAYPAREFAFPLAQPLSYDSRCDC